MILTKLCQIKTPGPLGFILLGMVSLLGDSYRKHMALTMAGETEWTKNGRYTGITGLELTYNGVQQVLGTKKTLVGPGKLIDPAKLAHVFVSRRKRAQKTFDLLFHGVGKDALDKDGKVSITEEIAEWDYGKYEGLLTKEIRARKEQGLDKEVPWDIWRDGCEDGECVTLCHARVLELD